MPQKKNFAQTPKPAPKPAPAPTEVPVSTITAQMPPAGSEPITSTDAEPSTSVPTMVVSVPFNPPTSPMEMAANLRAQGFDDYADQIELAHKDAVNKAISEAVDALDDVALAESVDPDQPYWHEYSHAEVLTLICGALMGKAEAWEAEAAAEMQKGAANTAMAGTLRWGAKQLTEFANVVIHLPEGEMVVPEPPETEEEAAAD